MIKKIKSQKEKVETARPQQSKVVFGFSSLNPVSYVEAKNDSHFFISFLDRLKKLSGLEWNTIWVTHRHGLGTEMIGREALKPNIQKMVPEDMNNVIVLRATGDNHSFLGYRDGNAFQVLFIEYRFGDIYKHA